ncbi:MAG: patatin-like phospholipase family protein [Burkholderiaceae bacterium]|nr:patatin-like phospholipase family protein [Burkholderiaceae bacterium]
MTYLPFQPTRILLLAALCCASFVAVAASGNSADAALLVPGRDRPKICLVLSGGGARGAAHVGVLKVLEANRIPIDCIAGTSMGALVGASYATGMSIPEMEAIVGEISTELLFKENPPRAEQPMRIKRDDYANLFGPDIGVVDNSLQLPKGVVTGIQLETVLRRLAKVKGYLNFDDLPIPFRAIATNLVTGKEVVFSKGEVGNVMRASMSVPGAIAPAEFDGMLLVDGMLTSNLPVQTAFAMGADIVIAVNVGTPLLGRDKLVSIVGVMGQMLSILTEQNVQVSLAALRSQDILISPELGSFSTGDFDNLPKIVPLGAAAAEKAVPRLAALALPPEAYASLRKSQLRTIEADLRPVDEIRFVDLKRVNPATARSIMETQEGQPLDQNKLDGDMRRLYGSGDFEHVNYRLVDEGTKRVLTVDAVEKSWGPNYLRFGLGLSTDFQNEAYYNIMARYRRTWLNSLGAEWRSTIQLGRTSTLFTEFYQPLSETGEYFVSPYVVLSSTSPSLFQGNTEVAQYNVASAAAGVDLGLNFKRYGVLRFGALTGVLKPSLQIGSPQYVPTDSSYAQGALNAKLTLDQIDSIFFPRSGWRGSATAFNSMTSMGASSNYQRYEAEGTAAVSFGEHTLNFGFHVGGKIGSDPLPVYDQFQWGGFLKQSGFQTGQLLGESVQFGRVMYYRRIFRGSLLEGAYGGISLEAGKVGEQPIPGGPTGLQKSGAIFIGADTPIGPAYLGYGRVLNGPGSFYFYLGRPF